MARADAALALTFCMVIWIVVFAQDPEVDAKKQLMSFSNVIKRLVLSGHATLVSPLGSARCGSARTAEGEASPRAHSADRPPVLLLATILSLRRQRSAKTTATLSKQLSATITRLKESIVASSTGGRSTECARGGSSPSARRGPFDVREELTGESNPLESDKMALSVSSLSAHASVCTSVPSLRRVGAPCGLTAAPPTCAEVSRPVVARQPSVAALTPLSSFGAFVRRTSSHVGRPIGPL
eukprot:594156-Prorocentrum_minimum.AAC.1